MKRPHPWPILWLFSLLLVVGGCRAQRAWEPIPTSTPAPSAVTGTLRVSFLDVGQGDAALVQTPSGGAMLIDGGPSGAGPRVLAALREAGIRRLDWIVGSHPHEDHIGGLVDVLREVPAAQVLDPGYVHGTQTQKTYLQLIKAKGSKLVSARAGQVYELGSGARMEILAPKEPLLKGTDSDPNNNSIVLRLVFGGTRYLFTGDMEEDERARLLRSVSPERLRSEVLKVAHHGSHNGTDPPFLRAVAPRYAVISLARDNDYGHPHREAMAVLRGSGAEILRTDERGTIAFRSDGKLLTVEGAAAQQAHPGPRSSPSSLSGTRWIGNPSSRIYHAPDCGRLPENRTGFSSAEAAEQAGYRPHRACTQ